jgi:hypothetical protein
MGPDGSGGDGSTTSVKEATDAAAAATAKRAIDAATTKEVTVMKTTTDVAVVKKATYDAPARVAVVDSATKAMVAEKAADESAARGDVEMEVMRKIAEKSAVSGSSPAPGAGCKRAATSGGSTLLLSGSAALGCPGMFSGSVVSFFSLFAPYLIRFFPVQHVGLWRDVSSR